jgi:putative RNA 2'-phosphotransferase
MTRLPRQLENLARMLGYLLCHRPDEFGLVLDADGFLPVKQLLRALTQEPGWGFVRRHHLEQLVGLLKPPALELAGERIRCLTPGPAQLRGAAGQTLPALLYAAIPPKAQARVWEMGLNPPPEGELVLAAAPEMARRIGRRRTPEPVLVTVQAQAAARAGIAFLAYGEGLFLAPALPREFLQLPPLPPQREKPRLERPATPGPTPGTFVVDLPQMLRPPEPARGKGKKKEPAWKAGARELRKKRRVK